MVRQSNDRRFWRTPLDRERIGQVRGDIHVLPERCKGCSYCVEYCPLDVLVLDTGFNAKGYHPPRVERAGVCVACRLCEALCPEFAIFVTERTERGGAQELRGIAP